MSMGINPRDAYLAWQADIGTDDVVLVQPWTKPRPTGSVHAEQASGYSGHSGHTGNFAPAPHSDGLDSLPTASSIQASQSAQAPVALGGNFFESVAAMLSKPEHSARTQRAARAAEPPPAPAPVSEIPEFKDLEAYWNFLDDTYPKWYPGVSAKPVRAEGSPRPVLAVVEFAPSGNGGAVGDRVFAGEAGELLERMLKAIGLERKHLYLTSLMKTPPPGKAWSRRDAARMLPAFQRELRLAECGLVLLLGETCAQIVMRTGQGLASLEEQAVNIEDLAFTATWHPEDLLKNEALKRNAWSHLKWVRARLPALGN